MLMMIPLLLYFVRTCTDIAVFVTLLLYMYWCACIILGIVSVSSTLQQYTVEQSPSISISDQITACCKLVHSDDHGSNNSSGLYYSQLFAQINNTAYNTYVELVESHRRVAHGPQLNVLLVTRSTANIFPYSAYSYLVQLIYSHINGYLLAPADNSVIADEDFEHYPKLSILLHHIQRADVNTDYVIWIDAGA